MATISQNFFSINGVISTDRSVMQNMNALCEAAGAFLTYDIAQGKWSVIINKAETTAVATFDDSNIIGGINISSTGVTELYNKVRIEFPHQDLRDQTDFIELAIPAADLFPNEVENTLNMKIDCINNPVQAQYLASVELRQSRVDKVIQFRTDYSYIGLKAGDIISVTNSVYDYTDKFFRITRVEEADDDILSISITALEYSDSVYSGADDLVRDVRIRSTGIVTKAANTSVLTSDAVAVSLNNATGSASYITPSYISAVTALGSGPFYDFLKVSSNLTTAGFKEDNPGASIPAFYGNALFVNGSTVLDAFNTYAGNVEATPGQQGSGFSGDFSASAYVSFTLEDSFDTLFINIENPFATYYMFPVVENYVLTDYGINSIEGYTGRIRSDDPGTTYVVEPVSIRSFPQLIADVAYTYTPKEIIAFIPYQATLFYDDGTGPVAVTTKVSNYQTSSNSLGYNAAPPGEYTIVFQPFVSSNAAGPDIYHGGYAPTPTVDGSSGSITVSVIALRAT